MGIPVCTSVSDFRDNKQVCMSRIGLRPALQDQGSHMYLRDEVVCIQGKGTRLCVTEWAQVVPLEYGAYLYLRNETQFCPRGTGLLSIPHLT